MADQAICVGVVTGVKRQADAGRDLHDMAVMHDRVCAGLEQAVYQRAAFFQALDICQHRNKLMTVVRFQKV